MQRRLPQLFFVQGSFDSSGPMSYFCCNARWICHWLVVQCFPAHVFLPSQTQILQQRFRSFCHKLPVCGGDLVGLCCFVRRACSIPCFVPPSLGSTDTLRICRHGVCAPFSHRIVSPGLLALHGRRSRRHLRGWEQASIVHSRPFPGQHAARQAEQVRHNRDGDQGLFGGMNLRVTWACKRSPDDVYPTPIG